MPNELEIKTHRLTMALKEHAVDAVLINAQHNFAWITGGRTNGIDLSRENGAANLLVLAKGKRYLLANNIEMPRMLAEEVSKTEFEPVEYKWQDERSNPDHVLDIARSIAGSKVVTDHEFEGKLAKCRYRLTSDEVLRIRSLGSDAATAFGNVIGNISPGRAEIEIAEILRHELAKAKITSVVTLVAADERIAGFRHPIPTENLLKKTLLLVSCAKRNGLIVSLSRMVCFGEVPHDLLRRIEATAYVNACFQEATSPGRSGSELFAVAASAYAKQGFADEIDRHHQGGAAGYKTREWVAHPNCQEIVELDQAFAWNPSITGTKVEDTSLVTENGTEILTSSPEFPKIGSIVNGSEYFSHGIMTI